MGFTRSPLSPWSCRASHGISQKMSWTFYRWLWTPRTSVPGDWGGRSQLMSHLRCSRSSLLLSSTRKRIHWAQIQVDGAEHTSMQATVRCYHPFKSHWRKRNYTCDLWSYQMHWADFCTSITQLISVSFLSWCLPKSFVCTLMLVLFLLDFWKRINLLPFLKIWERRFWHLGPFSHLILEDAESAAFQSYPRKCPLSSFEHAPSFVSPS